MARSWIHKIKDSEPSQVRWDPQSHNGRKEAMERDPVCGMEVDPKRVTDKSEYEGNMYYFCSADCKHRFDMEPEMYVLEEH
jgi:YHS domain-containing protein